MLKSGLLKVKPDQRDYSLLHTFGATPDTTKGLPETYTIYDGREIPNQGSIDTRFTPVVEPLPYGCTGETASFESSLQDNAVYRPDIPYKNTPPYRMDTGRDMRVMLGALCDQDVLVTQEGKKGPRRKAYFNCYGAGKIDDFDAARIALWINQGEKRGVWVGNWWYVQFAVPHGDGTLANPSYNINDALLHAHLITGWRTIDGKPYLESLSWQGMDYGKKGVVLFSREQYNALMAQPWTGAFTITKFDGDAPIPIGIRSIVDHLVYYIRSLFKV